MIKEYLANLPLSQAAKNARDTIVAEQAKLKKDVEQIQRHLEAISNNLAIQTRLLEEQKVYRPLIPRNGYNYIPPATFRHLEALREAMLADDEKTTLNLQMILANSGYEVPTTIDEVAEVTERLKQQVNVT